MNRSKIKKLFAILLLGGLFSITAHPLDELTNLQNQLEELKEEYQSKTETLQNSTELRWANRESELEQKSLNKVEEDQLSEEITSLQGVVDATSNENLLLVEKIKSAQQRLTASRQYEPQMIRSLKSELEQIRTENLASSPIQKEGRIIALQDIVLADESVKGELESLTGYLYNTIETKGELAISSEKIHYPENTPVTAMVLRVGQVGAIALIPSGELLYLSRTGRGHAFNFDWLPLANSEYSEQLKALFSNGETNSFAGVIPVDLLQDRNSHLVICGVEEGRFDAIKNVVEAGGILVYPLFILAIVALVLVIDRFVYYTWRHRQGEKFMAQATILLEKKQYNAALLFADKKKGFLSKLLTTSVKHKEWNRDVAQKALKEDLLKEMPSLERHLSSIAVLAAAAPLLGLLGTVTGMIAMFETITEFGSGDPKLLAGGISEALITTKIGLTIAIPTLLIHTVLQNRCSEIQGELEMFALTILNRIWPEQ